MRKLLLALPVLVLLAGVVGARFEGWVMAALDPSGPFDATRVPAPPDYDDPGAWTAHPAREDAADAVPEGLRAVGPARAPADVFYVHPTTYLGSGWNGQVDDPALNAETDALATRIQASAFNGCCAVWGPRYRQAQGQAFVRGGPDAAAAVALAYGDVRAAFRHFEAARGGERPFLLAGHSQGAALAMRLLREEVADTPRMARLVAAYLVGGPIAVGDAGAVPVCAAPEETGCLVGWHARGPRFRGSPFDFRVAGERLCVNPLTWQHDEAPAPATRNLGAVFLHAGDGSLLPGFADARCRDGWLRVETIGDVPRDLRSRVLDFVIGPGNHHPIEFQLYYANLWHNAEERVEAWLEAQAPD